MRKGGPGSSKDLLQPSYHLLPLRLLSKLLLEYICHHLSLSIFVFGGGGVLHQVLVEAHRLFAASCGIFSV